MGLNGAIYITLFSPISFFYFLAFCRLTLRYHFSGESWKAVLRWDKQSDQPFAISPRPPINNAMEQEIMLRLEAIEQYSLLAAKTVLTLNDVALLTGLSKSHLYKMTCQKQIPYYRPNGKQIYFDKAEVEAWMKQNRVSSAQEAEQAAAKYVAERRAVI